MKRRQLVSPSWKQIFRGLRVRAWGRLELKKALGGKGVVCSILEDGGGEAQARRGIIRDSDRERMAQVRRRTNRRDMGSLDQDIILTLRLGYILNIKSTIITPLLKGNYCLLEAAGCGSPGQSVGLWRVHQVLHYAAPDHGQLPLC